MRLSQKKVLEILRGQIVPGPDEIEEINRKIGQYYKLIKDVSSGRRLGLGARLDDELGLYLPYWRRFGHPTLENVLLVRLACFNVPSLEMFQPKYSPPYVDKNIEVVYREILLIYYAAGWMDAIPLDYPTPLPLPWDAVLGGETEMRSPRPFDAVLGGQSP